MKNIFDYPHNIHCPRMMGHRGFTPLAPENSLPSFEAAGKLGLWGIETDVHQTVDGVLVCCHDFTTKRMFSEDLLIESVSFEELQKIQIVSGNNVEKYNSEELRMPTFKQYLGICKKYGCVPFIETKGWVVEEIMRELEKEDLIDYAVISSCVFAHMEEARRLSSKIFIHHIFSDEEHMERLAELGYAGLSYDFTDLDNVPVDLLKRTHEKGVKYCLRAGDTQERVLRMMELELDYIPSNTMYPELFK